MMKKAGAKVTWSTEHQVPFMVLGDTWVGFDDPKSFALKVSFYLYLIIIKIIVLFVLLNKSITFFMLLYHYFTVFCSYKYV